LEKVSVPNIDSDQVLVKIRATLICGMDRKIHLRGYHLFNPPFVFEHEFSGDIIKFGKK
jgi:threonine dehydrogenase-like Zn-dependent dehydrogenase